MTIDLNGKRLTATFVAMVLAGAAAPAMADGDGGDVGFILADDGVITVAAADDEGDSAAAFVNGETEQFVFVTDMDSTGFADEPGFYINSFSNLPNTDTLFLSYTQEAPLLVYDAVSDSYVATDVQLGQINIPGIIANVTPETGSAPGLGYLINIDPTVGGEFDQHPDLQLLVDGAPSGFDPGVYLWQISFQFLDGIGGPEQFSTETVGILFVFEAEDLEEAAEAAAEAFIPTPGAAAVLAVGGVLATRRRRV